ncbi:unnamed protein product, partial [Brassica oleracea]
MNCWEVTGTKPRVKKEESAAETEKARSEASTSIGGMTKEKIEKSFNGIADVMRDGFGMCLREIKLLGNRIEAVEKKVGITKTWTASNELQITTSNPEKRGHEPGSENVNGENAGQNDPQELNLQKGETRRQIKRNAAMKHVRGKSERGRKLAASHQTPFKGNNTAKVIIPNKRFGQGYDPFTPFDKKMSKVLIDRVKLDPRLTNSSSVKSSRDDLPDDLSVIFSRRLNRRLTRRLKRKSSDKYLLLVLFYMQHMDAFINVLRQRYQDNPHHFRSERLCFLDHVFSRQWSHHYPEFKSDVGDINGLGRRLPGGAWNYHAGIVPSFCQSMKVWGLDVDDIY